MRQDMRTMYQHYLTHQAALRAFNPEFDVDFGPEWLTALNAADTAPTGTVRVGELKEDTAEVATVMEQAQSALQSLFYFVGRAFPHNAGRMTTYGRPTYDAARDNHDLMRTLLQTAFTSATRDKDALATKGYTAAQLAALGQLVAGLTDTNTTQEVKKGTNVEGTDDYVTIQNRAYGYGQEVSAAAKVRFAEDAATLKLFRLTDPAPAGPEAHELTVAPKDRGSVLFATPLLATTRLHLRLAVPQPGQQATVGRAVGPTSPLSNFLVLSSANSELTVTATELGDAGQWVLVFNANGTAAPVRVEITVLA
jgi:hypothetical protein